MTDIWTILFCVSTAAVLLLLMLDEEEIDLGPRD